MRPRASLLEGACADSAPNTSDIRSGLPTFLRCFELFGQPADSVSEELAISYDRIREHG